MNQASVDARDAMWQHPELLPDTENLRYPAAFIGGDTSGIDEAFAEFERRPESGNDGPEELSRRC